MKRSTESILTTHTGSLPRPDDLVELLYAEEAGEATDPTALRDRVRSAVSESVHEQIEAGIDIVNDGEMSKVSYSTYVNARLTGFEGHVHVPRRPRPDAAAFPRYAEWNAKQQQGASRIKRYACMGPVTYVGQAQLKADIDNLKTALSTAGAVWERRLGTFSENVPNLAAGELATDCFMTAASPGVISWFQPNQYYPSEAAYLEVLADAMREEYEAIYQAGFLLQLDC